MSQSACTYEGCEKSSYSASLCQGHAWQKKNKGVLTPLRAYTQTPKPEVKCALPLCLHPANGKSILCKAHRAIVRNYSLTDEAYVEMYALGCLICERTDISLSVDHDHSCCSERKKSCGKCVRGLLCSDCNFLVGWFDKIELDRIRAVSNLAWYYEDYARWGAHEKAVAGA